MRLGRIDGKQSSCGRSINNPDWFFDILLGISQCELDILGFGRSHSNIGLLCHSRRSNLHTSGRTMNVSCALRIGRILIVVGVGFDKEILETSGLVKQPNKTRMQTRVVHFCSNLHLLMAVNFLYRRHSRLAIAR